MTALETMTDCPNEETLAAFIDNRLTGDERTRVVAHLAQCGNCRDLVWLAVDVKAEEVPPANVKPFTSRRKWIVTSLAAAAAAVVVVVGVSRLQPSDPMRGLIETSATLKNRPVDGRLAGFPYRPAKAAQRGGPDESKAIEPDDLKILTAAREVEEDVGDDQSSKARYALAIANLVAGERAQAMAILRPALLQETKAADLETAVDRSTNARLLNDFSVVALANGNDKIALRAAERSFALAPTAEAAWNRAAARQVLDRKPIEAWQDYLRIDPDSPWSNEARKKIEDLTPPDL